MFFWSSVSLSYLTQTTHNTKTNPQKHERDWQWCTEGLAQELPYFSASGGVKDMFWDQRPDWGAVDAVDAHCREAWRGVVPRPDLTLLEYGGADWGDVTNVVFSNGLFDPWSAYGLTEDDPRGAEVVVLDIVDGAHHSDLMFSLPSDSRHLKKARATELAHVRRWVREAEQRRRRPRQGDAAAAVQQA